VLAVEQYEIEYTYRQEKDEKLLKFLVLFSWEALLLCPQKLFLVMSYKARQIALQFISPL